MSSLTECELTQLQAYAQQLSQTPPPKDKRAKLLTSHRRLHAIAGVRSRDGYNCHYCLTPLEAKPCAQQVTLDHVVPRLLGGRNKLSNFVLACRTCNNTRDVCVDACWCPTCVSAWMWHRSYE